MQATRTINRTGIGPVFVIAIAAIILLAVLPITVDLSLSHAAERHSISGVEAIRKCLKDNGPMQIWINPDTGRRAFVCKLPSGQFGIQIIQKVGGEWKEITAFVKDKVSNIGQVMRYLTNTGYYIKH